MPRIEQLRIRNVRCFSGEHSARTSRITLLVGENSIGKTTFLACYNAFATLCNLNEGTENNPFDVPPFLLGDFNSIARDTDREFSVAGTFSDHIHCEAEFTFGRGIGSLPSENIVRFVYQESESDLYSKEISISEQADQTKKYILFDGPNFQFNLPCADISFLSISKWLSRNARHGFMPYDGNIETFKHRLGAEATPKNVVQFAKFTNYFRSEMPLPNRQSFNVVALTPELPRRKRSYDSPPVHMESTEDRKNSNKIGRDLNLWNEVDIVANPDNNSTEISITTDNNTRNLVDVGYGVHALLPIASQISKNNMQKVFLLQQPEIHIHPSAQAKLAEYMARSSHDFIIETHSDHIVDRMRSCILKGVLQPEELSILYFEKDAKKPESKIFSISVDKQANLLDVPDSYRLFFLEETERLLGIR